MGLCSSSSRPIFFTHSITVRESHRFFLPSSWLLSFLVHAFLPPPRPCGILLSLAGLLSLAPSVCSRPTLPYAPFSLHPSAACWLFRRPSTVAEALLQLLTDSAKFVLGRGTLRTLWRAWVPRGGESPLRFDRPMFWWWPVPLLTLLLLSVIAGGEWCVTEHEHRDRDNTFTPRVLRHRQRERMGAKVIDRESK